jgi:hypothetical protein
MGAKRMTTSSWQCRGCRIGAVALLSLIAANGFAWQPNETSPGRDWIELTGRDLAAWKQPTGLWSVVGSAAKNTDNEAQLATKPGVGILVNGSNGRTVNLLSNAMHGDIEAKLEFMIPKGSNSGVYFQGRYEIQVLDSFGVEKPKYSDCGGVYQRWDPKRGAGREGFDGRAPRVNAARPPGESQTLDVLFRAPRFTATGDKTANARFVRVVLNSVVIHENVEVTGPTRAAAFDDERPVGPLMLQGDHGPVAYRNLQIRPLAPNTND